MALKLKNKIKNCSNCGKIFAPLRNETLCRDCMREQEEKEIAVLDYVRENQGCLINEVMKAMGVTEKFIRNMINKGLFANIDRKDFYYPCAVCGKPIKNGTYCSDCLSKLRKETQKMAQEMAVRTGLQSQAPTKPAKDLTTIEKLNIQAEKEIEKENAARRRRGTYETIVNQRDGRIIGKRRDN